MPNYFKNKKSVYKPAQVLTHYGKHVERDVITHPTTGESWMFVIEALEERIVKAGPNDCWGWAGAYHRQGYGMFNIRRTDGKKNGNVTARRVIMALKLGRPLLHDEQVFATCHNPECTNPAHLQIGTNDEKHVNNILAPTFSGNRRVFGRQFYVTNKDYLLGTTPKFIAEKYNLSYSQAANVKNTLRRLMQAGKIV